MKDERNANAQTPNWLTVSAAGHAPCRDASHALDTAKYQETKHIELLLRACCSCELSAPVSVCVVCVSCLRPVVSSSD